ncbi:MAG: hypothetical protein CM15mP42_06150 [Methanobacteriota archaeon]|nr:MAG: hypothetical protein CM15mP42_06150 [Euryarchaeota archaeon]
MSEEEKKTEDKPSEKSSSGYKGKKSNNDNSPKRTSIISCSTGRKAAEERISKWTPKTELGRKVVSGEITTIKEALASGLPLREAPIVDLLITDMMEEVIDIHMVQRMSDSGRRVRFAVTTIVGNGDGVVGLGAFLEN